MAGPDRVPPAYRDRKRLVADVLAMTAQGMSRTQVGAALGITRATVCGIIYRADPELARNPNGVKWDVARVERLRQLVLAGNTVTEMARIMGLARSVVSRVLKRHLPELTVTKTRSLQNRVKPRRRMPPTNGTTRGMGALFRSNAAAVRAYVPPPAEPPPLTMVDIMELTDAMCKWPIGEPRTPGFGFCGAAADGAPPYCRYHARLAYQPVERRRERVSA